jgi:DNA transposition AAA+ family ATPase
MSLKNFIPTQNYQHLAERCKGVLDSRLSIELAEVSGPAGRGKTTAVQHLVAQWPNAVYLRFNEDMRFGNRIYSEVAYRLTGTRPEKTCQSWSIIEKALSERRYILFFDEADRLSVRHLNALRDLHDNFQTPVVFVGEEPLIAKVDSERRLRDRMAFRLQFKPITEADVIMVFKMADVSLADMDRKVLPQAVELLLSKSGGTFRPVVHFARECKRVMNVNEMKVVTLDVIRSVCRGRK